MVYTKNEPKRPQAQKNIDPRQPHQPSEKTPHTAIAAALGITMVLIFGIVGAMDYNDAKMAAEFKMPAESTRGVMR